MHICMVTPHIAPFGPNNMIAETTAALCRELSGQGHKLTVIAPYFAGLSVEQHGFAKRLRTIKTTLGTQTKEVSLVDGKLPHCEANVIFLSGQPQFAENFFSSQTPELDQLFIFASTALELIKDLNPVVEILHVHDWAMSFVLLLNKSSELATIFSFYDLPVALTVNKEQLTSYQLSTTDNEQPYYLGPRAAAVADYLVAPSASYSRELLAAKTLAGSYSDVFSAKGKRFTGIIGGVDSLQFNSSNNRLLIANFSRESLNGKSLCRKELQTILGFENQIDLPLLIVPTATTDGRGLQLLLDQATQLIQLKAQILFLGENYSCPDRLSELTTRYTRNFAYRSSADTAFLHSALAGSDAILIPTYDSFSDLWPLKALAYATLPVVCSSGSFNESIVNFDERTSTGFGLLFAPNNTDAMFSAIHRLFQLYRQETAFNSLRQNALSQTYCWKQTATRYQEIYQNARAGKSLQ